MASQPTRRQLLQLGGLSLATGIAGCLGADAEPESVAMDFSPLDRISSTNLPGKTITTTGDDKPTFREYFAEDEPDTVVVLLHNATLDSRSMHRIARSIAGTDTAHAVTTNLRGHGSNPIRRGDINYYNQYLTDLHDIITTEEIIRDPETVILAGHGAGGGLTVRAAAGLLSNTIDGVLLLAPHLGRDAESTRSNLGGWEQYASQQLTLARILNEGGVTRYNDLDVVEYAMPDSAQQGWETLSYTFRLYGSLLPRNPTDILEFDHPTLTIAGTDDEAMIPGIYESLLEDEENKETVIFDGLTHMELLSDWEVIRQIINWVDQFN